MSNVKISIVLGTYNRLRFLKSAIDSIRNSKIPFEYEIIVVDGGSKDGTIKWLTKQIDIISIIQHNRVYKGGVKVRLKSWGFFMNLAFRASSGKFICMISDDSVLQPDALKKGFEYFEYLLSDGRKVGAVPFYWRSWPEEETYRVGRTFSDKHFVNHGMFLTEALQCVGWLDSETYSFYCADGDVALRLCQAGYEIVPCKNALVEHYEHSNMAVRKNNNEQYQNDWDAYTKRWAGIFYDPETKYPGTWDRINATPLKDPRKLFPLTRFELAYIKIKPNNY